MATTKRPGLPYVWVTWLTKILAGEGQCLYQPWLKAHFRYDKRPDTTFNLAGWVVTLERQNAFQLFGKSAILAGQPDIVAVRPGETLVVDGKTGQQRHSDLWQVLVYMVVLPRCRENLTNIRGEVCYKSHRVPVEREELTPARAEAIYKLLRTIAGERLATTPSQKECGFCDVADCADRFVESEAGRA